MKKRPAKKIALVGTSCVGKSTLLTELQQRLKHRSDIIFIEEQARKYFEENRSIINRFAQEHQQAIQKLILKAEKAAHKNSPKAIVCDRSALDAAVYVSTFIGRENGLELINNIQTWLPTYTKIFLLDPADVPYEADEIRDEDVTARQRVHNEFAWMLKRHKVPHELLSGSMEQRALKVTEHIS